MELPKTVNFTIHGYPNVQCVAAIYFQSKYLLNMGTCLINFDKKPKVTVEYLPHSARILINDGEIWFDVDGQSAAEIERLFS